MLLLQHCMAMPGIVQESFKVFCRFYHRAALMIWPKAQRWRHMCCSQNLTTCMSALEKYAKAMHANQQLIPMVTASKTRANSVQAPGSDTAAATSSAITGNEPVKDAEEACQLAEAMWSQFGSWQLITNASKLPTARFSQLVSQLGMHALLTKLAHKMQVVMHTWLNECSMAALPSGTARNPVPSMLKTGISCKSGRHATSLCDPYVIPFNHSCSCIPKPHFGPVWTV